MMRGVKQLGVAHRDTEVACGTLSALLPSRVMDSARDPARNIAAVTHFLELVNGSEVEHPVSQDAPHSGSDAAESLLRALSAGGSLPLDEGLRHTGLSLLDFSDVLNRMRKAGLIALVPSATSDAELLTLTEDGARFARLVERPLASA